MINLQETENRTLPFSLAVYFWIEKLDTQQSTKYRIQKIILTAILQNSRQFFLTKNAFEKLIESRSRRTQKTLLSDMQQLGIITLLREDHFQLHFELVHELFDGEALMQNACLLTPRFEDPLKYRNQFSEGDLDDMARTKTIERYNDQITDILSEISSKDILEKMSSDHALKQAFHDRVNSLKIKIKTFEKRHNIKLTKEISNLDSISNILDTVKTFNQETNTYEEHKKANRIKISPKDVVTYFYKKLSHKLNEAVYVSCWPSEIEAAKAVLRQMPDKNSEFVKGYIDWIINTHNKISKVFSSRYHVPDYLRTLDEQKFWEPIWKSYLSRMSKQDEIVEPKNEEELACLFAAIYEKKYHQQYNATQGVRKDISKLKQQLSYLGGNLKSCTNFVIWCFEKAFHTQKPSNPGDLFRFIQDFRDIEARKVHDSSDVDTVQTIVKRAARRNSDIKLNDWEKDTLKKLLKVVKTETLDNTTRKIMSDNVDIFSSCTGSLSIDVQIDLKASNQ